MKETLGNSQFIQKINRLKVLQYIRRNPNSARQTIARKTGLSGSSLSNITGYLLDVGLLEECGTEEAERVGRKSTLLRFRAENYGLIAVLPEVGRIRVFYTDLSGRVMHRIEKNVEKLQPEELISLLADDTELLLSEFGREKTLGIQIAISGMVLDGNCFTLSASMQWTEYDLAKALREKTGLPVFLENGTPLKAAWYFNHQRIAKEETMLFVDLKNGIGACQYREGEINRGFLGEIGHTTVEKNGEMCFCGNRGCLEAMCSTRRILKRYAEYSGAQVFTMEEIAARLAQKDPSAECAVEECACYLGIGLSNLIMFCRASAVVIDVGDFAALPDFSDRALAEMKRRVYPALSRRIGIKTVQLTEENLIGGAAVCFCDRFFEGDNRLI